MPILLKEYIKKIPFVNVFVNFLKSIKPAIFHEMSLYDVIKLYFEGIANGAVTQRASAIAFSFFMALFPFALFLFNLIPYIPLENFQADFLEFVSQNVPPNTYDAIANIINDILNKSHKGLLSTGILLSIYLMSNGINALLDGFEMSSHISIKRGYFRQYSIAIGLSLIIAFLLIFTVAAIVVFEIFIQKIENQVGLSTNASVLQICRYVFVGMMVLTITSMLYKLGTKETKQVAFFSYGSIFTTLLFALSSYVFGIYVERFARYNELYGSIGTLLVMMFYVWINCILLLIGFELNAFIYKMKKKN
ncbi:YihY/virulence factor BrkB family protein [Flavobacterium urocaniciphilum]|uniref:Membrane protein n=1 Tax=Flavobacterium urocaniciphilum TaxID=1299341 RepID=A0A1H9E639_9FLAO|nr:YihY/virulence factor BrkB family protein [Flavobacterium urocaniciphilum]SEQ21087.1 membrane protein [Flavobacterium urocaniciphilum]